MECFHKYLCFYQRGNIFTIVQSEHVFFLYFKHLFLLIKEKNALPVIIISYSLCMVIILKIVFEKDTPVVWHFNLVVNFLHHLKRAFYSNI